MRAYKYLATVFLGEQSPRRRWNIGWGGGNIELYLTEREFLKMEGVWN
jgi:hypothetical protein